MKRPDDPAVIVQHTHAELVQSIYRAHKSKEDLLEQLMEDGKRRVEEEMLAKNLKGDGGLMVRIMVERVCVPKDGTEDEPST